MAIMESGDPLVSASWLKANVSAPDVRLVDATYFPAFNNPKETGREAFNRGHIPGAVFFDIDEIADTASPFPHMLPDPVKFAARVRALGVGDGHRVIVYDQNGFFASARVWWMFRYMGKTDVKVLDGGLAAWIALGGELDDLPTPVSTRHFTPRVRADLLADTPHVAAAIATGNATIIDARPAVRFTGEAPEPREGLPSGHMPGARSIPSSTLLEPGGKMKSSEALRELFGAQSDPVIATCGSGITAAITALALARLGDWNVAVYDGSWTEWASDPARPVVRGEG